MFLRTIGNKSIGLTTSKTTIAVEAQVIIITTDVSEKVEIVTENESHDRAGKRGGPR